MHLFDFFFPEQAQASHLRRLSENQGLGYRQKMIEENMRSRRHAEIDRRLEHLEEELGFLTLMLESIVRKIEEKGVFTRAELKELMQSVDREDGRADGKFTPPI